MAKWSKSKHYPASQWSQPVDYWIFLKAIYSQKYFYIVQVCSLHFRQGRPSSDPSHEDFVPHLYLNRDTPPEIIQCLESLAEKKMEPEWFIENEVKIFSKNSRYFFSFLYSIIIKTISRIFGYTIGCFSIYTLNFRIMDLTHRLDWVAFVGRWFCNVSEKWYLNDQKLKQ